jgi:hypothetical protein
MDLREGKRSRIPHEKDSLASIPALASQWMKKELMMDVHRKLST